VREAPEVSYTPKGRKIVTFPMWVPDGDFNIMVIGGGETLSGGMDSTAGGEVLVAGELIRTKLRTRDALRVKASKIIWTEE
jgi:hypothetical protein